ncbi:DUF4010 domain-containing protein [Flavobacterium sufflavum]|uniref:DUF4010 domain-containing protein n=1 Tax=Flavobacterium sufflavum TaxID=1921138 RepID=A0A3S2UKP8_9FLAO|nr:DUF4010 domain-containing protein [Flavobacterium sufflavum]RVT72333.1 DUF4010 domain-containing protein [Flavobacterium sufflavum]
MKESNEFIDLLPPDLIKFVLVVLFSLLIGLEQRRQFLDSNIGSRFGTDRAFTLIGILGFILYSLSPATLIPFLGGGFVLSIFLAIFYFIRGFHQKKFSLTSIIVALITFCLTPIIYTQPDWLVILIVVSVLILVEIKEALFDFSKKIDDNEFITLAEFLVIAGVILPLLPNESFSENITISPYKFWLAIVAVSGISYFSYLLKKFVFPKSGIVLTGILGGLYSSTVTTFILAKKSKELEEDYKITAAIILATTMMFIRIFILALLFNKPIAMQLAPSFGFFVVVTTLFALYFLWLDQKKTNKTETKQEISSMSNPLEFKTSLVFGILFIVFALLTSFVNKQYGTSGIKILSFVVGITDIDPFIINIFQSKWSITNGILTTAVINAVTSNNLLKMIYSITLSKKTIRKPILFSFSILIIIGLVVAFLF